MFTFYLQRWKTPWTREECLTNVHPKFDDERTKVKINVSFRLSRLRKTKVKTLFFLFTPNLTGDLKVSHTTSKTERGVGRVREVPSGSK